MSFSELAGYFLAIFVGISLGMFGSGGSILSVPILVYVFNVPPVFATAYSLFIVGSTALIGTVQKIAQKLVDFKTALLLGLPAIVSVFITRKFIVAGIPNTIRWENGFVIQKSIAIMVTFAIVMMIAAVRMILSRPSESASSKDKSPILIILFGVLIGLVAGFTGAGGGFLIVPVLLYFTNLPMSKAVATSLFIVAIQSLIGFSGDLYNQIFMDWNLILGFTLCAIFGIYIGNMLAKKTPADNLRRYFGWFILIVGIYTVTRELF